jgi:predicted nucleic acid-binding protein
MRTCSVDTNLFIRYLTNDDTKKADRVGRLLAEAAIGKTKLVTADLVVAEIIRVLESA